MIPIIRVNRTWKNVRIVYWRLLKLHQGTVLELSSFNFANLKCQLVEIIRLILPNSTKWYIIFAELKPLQNTKSSICNILKYILKIILKYNINYIITKNIHVTYLPRFGACWKFEFFWVPKINYFPGLCSKSLSSW